MRKAGFEPGQAEAIVATLSEDARDDLATKPDIDRLEARIDRVGERLDRVEARLDRIEGKVDEAVKQLKDKIDRGENRIDGKIEQTNANLLWIVVGGGLTLMAVIMILGTSVTIALR